MWTWQILLLSNFVYFLSGFFKNLSNYFTLLKCCIYSVMYSISKNIDQAFSFTFLNLMSEVLHFRFIPPSILFKWLRGWQYPLGCVCVRSIQASNLGKIWRKPLEFLDYNRDLNGRLIDKCCSKNGLCINPQPLHVSLYIIPFRPRNFRG